MLRVEANASDPALFAFSDALESKERTIRHALELKSLTEYKATKQIETVVIQQFFKMINFNIFGDAKVQRIFPQNVFSKIFSSKLFLQKIFLQNT